MVLKKVLTEAGGVGGGIEGGREGERKGEKERLMRSPHHMWTCMIPQWSHTEPKAIPPEDRLIQVPGTKLNIFWCRCLVTHVAASLKSSGLPFAQPAVLLLFTATYAAHNNSGSISSILQPSTNFSHNFIPSSNNSWSVGIYCSDSSVSTQGKSFRYSEPLFALLIHFTIN